MATIRRRDHGVLGVSFLNRNPDWADLAYELLFRRESKQGTGDGNYSLQHAVAEGLKVAYEMGQQGRKPPWPTNKDPRRHEPPPPDPETEQIANEMRLLAWSPSAGTDQPEGHMKWKLEKIFAERNAKMAPASTKVVSRRRAAAAPVQPPVIRRSRRAG